MRTFERRFLPILLFLAVALVPALTSGEERNSAVVERFRAMLEKSPKPGIAFDRVYDGYADAGRGAELLAEYKARAEAAPDDPKAFLLLGMVAARRHEESTASEAFGRAAELDKTSPLAASLWADALLAQGRTREAARALEIALQRNPSKETLADLMTKLGRIYERLGETDAAARIWRRLDEALPDDPDVSLRVAETLAEEGKFAESLERYEKLIRLSASDDYARVRYALAAADLKIKLGRRADALADFEKIRSELSAENWLSRSVNDRFERLFLDESDDAGLADFYENRLLKNPNDAETARRLAAALVRLGRLDEAQKKISEAIKNAPTDISLRRARIDLLLRESAFDEADAEFAELEKLDPENPDVPAQRGLAVLANPQLEESARRKKAAEIWNRLILERADDPARLLFAAELFDKNGFADEALRAYRRAVELAPDDPAYSESLGHFYQRLGRKEEAAAALNEIASGTRETAPNLDLLSGIFHSLGWADEALDAARRASELAPNNFDLALRLAERFDDAAQNGVSATEENSFNALLENARRLAASDDDWSALTRLEIKTAARDQKLGEKILPLQTALAGFEKAVDVKSANEFWRLASFLEAAGKTDEAARAMARGIAFDGASPRIISDAASLFRRNRKEAESLEALARLAKIDPVRRGEHLKRRAELLRDLGRADEAVETARQVTEERMTPENARFLAETLFTAGNRAEGIATLRRAVRLFPKENDFVEKLADALAGQGDSGEAFELYERLYERFDEQLGKGAAENESKTRVLVRMATLAKEAGTLDRLIGRLRRDAADAQNRRESILALAEVFLTVQEDGAAQEAIESLLTEENAAASDNADILERLSRIAEARGDFSGAIRYQERAVERSNSPDANDRLLTLCRAAGKNERATEIFLQTVLPKLDFSERLRAVEEAISRNDLDEAKKIVERLDVEKPGDWEVLYRRAEVDFLIGKKAEEKTSDEIPPADWTRFDAAVKNVRAEAPLDSDSIPALKKRLRLERFLTAFPKTAPLGMTPAPRGCGDAPEAVRRTEQRLALLGDSESLPAAAGTILAELARREKFTALEKIPAPEESLGRELDRLGAKERQRKETVQKILDELRQFKESEKEPLPLELPLEYLEKAESLPPRPNPIRYRLSALRRALEASGRSDELRRYDAAIFRLSRKEPLLHLSLLFGEIPDPILERLAGKKDDETAGRIVAAARERTEKMFADAEASGTPFDSAGISAFDAALSAVAFEILSAPLSDLIGGSGETATLPTALPPFLRPFARRQAKKILSADDLARLDAAQKRLKELLYLYYDALEQFGARFSDEESSRALTDFLHQPFPSVGLRGYRVVEMLQRAGYAAANYDALGGDFQQKTFHYLQKIDETLRRASGDESVSDEKIRAAANRLRRFDEIRAERKKNGSVFLAERITRFEDLLTIDLGEGSQATIDTSALTEKLDVDYRAAKAANRPFDPGRALLLAALHSGAGDRDGAIRILDDIPLRSAEENRLREEIVLGIFLQYPENKERANLAVERLGGYSLDAPELFTLREVCLRLEKKEESDAILARLLAADADLPTEYRLLGELEKLGDDWKEKGLPLAFRVYRENAGADAPNDLRTKARLRARSLLEKWGKVDAKAPPPETGLPDAAPRRSSPADGTEYN